MTVTASALASSCEKRKSRDHQPLLIASLVYWFLVGFDLSWDHMLVHKRTRIAYKGSQIPSTLLTGRVVIFPKYPREAREAPRGCPGGREHPRPGDNINTEEDLGSNGKNCER